jgi:AcrR family transcriptional regulator
MATTRMGRRPGESGTKEAIARAARRQFATRGYDRATLRGIAADAGVDVALISHFFGSKQRLFVTVMGIPFSPREVLPEIVGAGIDGAGERLARFILSLLEDPDGRARITGIVRAAASEPEAAGAVRDLITRELIGAFVEHLGVPDAELRATLVGSQVVGLVMARYVVGVEPLASLDPEGVVAAVAPTFQRYLEGPLGA